MKKVIIFILIIISIVLVIRFLTPEDTWIKDPTSFLDMLGTTLGAGKAGNWVKHGNPRSAKPTYIVPTKKPNVRREELLGYCGVSSYGKCDYDIDCYITGCNKEICQSKKEEPILSACVILTCHKKPAEVTCQCKEKECQWGKD